MMVGYKNYRLMGYFVAIYPLRFSVKKFLYFFKKINKDTVSLKQTAYFLNIYTTSFPYFSHVRFARKQAIQRRATT